MSDNMELHVFSLQWELNRICCDVCVCGGGGVMPFLVNFMPPCVCVCVCV